MPQATYCGAAGKWDNGLKFRLLIRPRRQHEDTVINPLILWPVQGHMPGYKVDFNIFNYSYFFEYII